MVHFIISGDIHAGKTTFAKELAKELSTLGVGVGGFLSVGTFKENERATFSLLGLLSGEEALLASTNEADISGEKVPFMKYFFSKEAIELGKNEFLAAVNYGSNFIFIDEVGKMELDGAGWAPLFQSLPSASSIIAVVRSGLVDEVNKRFFQGAAKVISIDESLDKAMEILEPALA